MADKLVSMKITAAERKKNQEGMLAPSSTEDSGPQYPYGLQLSLEQEALKKLKVALPKVGKEFTLIARVTVTSVSSYENVGQDARGSVGLQITEMCLESPGTDVADALYKDKA
jgi:hypothetical protein